MGQRKKKENKKGRRKDKADSHAIAILEVCVQALVKGKIRQKEDSNMQ